MYKRLFLAIPVPDHIQHQIKRCLLPWLDDGVRVVPPENWHVTVFFLGELHEARIPFLQEKVRLVITQTEPFMLLGQELSFGPPKRRPTMIWSFCQKNNIYEVLSQKIYDSIAFMLKESVKEDNTHELIPHITLARFRYKPHSLKGKQPILCEFEIPVEEIVLYESILDSQGVRYKRIGEFHLGKE